MSEVVPANVVTPNVGLNKPDVGGDLDLWGDFLNENADILDTEIAALRGLTGGGPFLPLTGGTLTGPTTFTAPITAWIPERTLFNGIATQHVPNLNAAIARATSSAPALIGIIGDSTSVATSASSHSEGMTEHLRQALAEQFGANANISIFNFGIGGQTWTTLDGIPTGFDWWYSNHSNAWLTYPQNYTVGTSVGCDCLVIAMGTNDRNSLDIARVASVVGKIRAWSKLCDIILVTNPRGSSVYSGTSGAAQQATFDYSASYVRSYAIRNRLGLIDANRWLTVIRDGYDPLETTMQVGLNGVDLPFPYTFPSALLDYSFQWYAGAAGGIFNGNTFTAQIGADAGNILQITQDPGGNFAYQIATKSGVYTTSYTVTNIACPTSGDAVFEVCIKGSHVTFNMITATYPNFGVRIVDAWFDKIGGTFTPTLGFASGGFGHMYTAIGVPARYQTQASDLEIYGDVNGNSFPFGGSGGLHMSSIGQQRVYNALFRRAQWSAASNFLPLSGGRLSGGLSFGTRQTASATDVTQHISLFDGFGGFSVSGGYINLVANNNLIGRTSGSSFDFAPGVPMTVQGTCTAATYALAGGPTWTTGSTAPASTQPVGSLYSRTGGAVGATLYVSRGGGTWAAVAGV